MNATKAYADLLQFGRPVLTTEDAALRLRVSTAAASHRLSGLACEGLVMKLRHGLWSLDRDLDPLLLPEYLTAPYPAYVSFQSALYLHGMVSQVPQVTYVASLGEPRRILTSVGTFSVHRLAPEFFGGFEVTRRGVRLASPAKALIDVLYLSNSRTGLFRTLPELEVPVRFGVRAALRWISRISGPYRQTMVTRRLEAILDRSAIGRADEG